jgi:hypothetical protein
MATPVINVNPGPNIVTPVIQRGASVVSIPSPIGVVITANASGTARVPVNGVLPGDVVVISPSFAPATGLNLVSSWVDSANSVTIAYVNSTAGNLSPTSDTYHAYIVRGYPVVYDFGVTILNNSGVVAGSNP